MTKKMSNIFLCSNMSWKIYIYIVLNFDTRKPYWHLRIILFYFLFSKHTEIIIFSFSKKKNSRERKLKFTYKYSLVQYYCNSKSYKISFSSLSSHFTSEKIQMKFGANLKTKLIGSFSWPLISYICKCKKL